MWYHIEKKVLMIFRGEFPWLHINFRTQCIIMTKITLSLPSRSLLFESCPDFLQNWLFSRKYFKYPRLRKKLLSLRLKTSFETQTELEHNTVKIQTVLIYLSLFIGSCSNTNDFFLTEDKFCFISESRNSCSSKTKNLKASKKFLLLQNGIYVVGVDIVLITSIQVVD